MGVFGGSDREEPAVVAARKGDVEALRPMLMSKATTLDIRSRAAFAGAEAGQPATLDLLLGAGVPANTCTKRVIDPHQMGVDVGSNPLIYAAAGAREGDALACVEVLLARGADPKAEAGSGATPLMRAAGRGDLAMMRRFIELGCDASRNSFHGTAMHWAAGAGQVQAMKLLAAHGASPAVPRFDGYTPLDEARQNCQAQAAAWLEAAIAEGRRSARHA